MKHFFKIASFSLALCAFLGTASLKEGAFLNAGAPTAEAAEAPLLNFQIVSDIHYNINGYNTGYAEPRPKFLSALDFNAEHFPGSDALVVAGDFTVAGTEDQYSQFFGDVSARNTADAVIVAMGNHEYEFGLGGRLNAAHFPAQKERYCRYVGRTLFGKPLTHTYYDYWIKDHHFIVMNSENWVDGSGKAYISQEQLQWLRRALAQNVSPDKPIFLISHQPLEGTIDRSDVWGLGAAAQSVKEILADYPQTILFSGHLHNGHYGYDAVYNASFGTLIDLPAFQYNNFGNNSPGTAMGYNVNVFRGKTELTPVDYQTGKILDGEKIVVGRPLTDGAYSASDIETKATLGGTAVKEIVDGNAATCRSFGKGDTLVLKTPRTAKIAGVRLRTAPDIMFKSKIGPYNCPTSEGTSYADSAWNGCRVKAGGAILQEVSAELPRWGTCMAVGFEEDYKKDLGWIFIETPCETDAVEITFSGKAEVSEIVLSAQRKTVFPDTYEMQMQYERLAALSADDFTEESLQAVRYELERWKNTVYSATVTQGHVDECLAALKVAEQMLVQKEKDRTPPVISGAVIPETAKVGEVLTFPTVTAADDRDGELSVSFSAKHNGTLLGYLGDSLTLKEGTYEFTWKATDLSGNTAKVTKILRVGGQGCKGAAGAEIGFLSLFALLGASLSAKRKK